MVGFIFGSKDKDKPWTYEELQRKREIAETLAAGNLRTPQNVGEGLASIGRALMYRKLDKKASSEETRLRDEFNAKWGSVLGGLGGGGAYASTSGGTPSGTWTPAAPAPGPVEQVTQGMDVAKSGGLSFGNLPKADPGVIGGGKEPLDFGAAVMTPQEMLIEGAKRRGLDPIDVATAISYETGGKFDPMLAGPTTQWGTHRGLIQFGEPQAQQHGVDFSNADAAWRSQLNPDSGAVWSYLDGAGVKPGMGLDQVYSAINAGSVGRMGASDANNGGAPGTVADKVAGMAPHREKAAAFLGGTWTPNPNAGGSVTMSAKGAPSGGGLDIGALIALGGDPMASPQQQAIVSALLQQEMQKMDPAYQMQLEKQRLELEALKNPGKPKPIEVGGVLLDPITMQPIFDSRDGGKPPASVAEYQFYVDEAKKAGKTPMSYEDFLVADEKASVPPGAPNIGTIPQGYEAIQDPKSGAWSMRAIPGGPEDTAAKDAAKASGLAVASDVITTAADRALEANSGRMAGGLLGYAASFNPSTPNAEVYRQVDVLTANAKVENLQAMRNESPTGGALGSVTEKETQMLADQAGALDPASPHFERDLMDYTRNLLRVIHGDEAGTALFNEKYGKAATGEADADGWTTLPNGIKVRVKQ